MRAYLSSAAVLLCGAGLCAGSVSCGIGAAIAQAPVVDECCLQLCFGEDWHVGLLRELAACKTLGMPRQAKQKGPQLCTELHYVSAPLSRGVWLPVFAGPYIF